MSRGLGDVYKRQPFVGSSIKQKTAYEIAQCLVGSEMCIRDRAKEARRLGKLVNFGSEFGACLLYTF
ncbi:hypothetical protein JMUB7552_27270 [Staphylococcus aureus]